MSVVQGSQRKVKKCKTLLEDRLSQPEENKCPNHCRKFALRDKEDPAFQESCLHLHLETCERCENLKSVLDDVEGHIRGSSWNPYSKEQQDDLVYDFKQALSTY